ncbi:MAG: hypothetical protein KatS3mg031_0349 [Chitinophagales bacterium]|nr:MAG: hypothetical protein KatS3mg031_0349 [Chitinophagales bacterium]
MRLEHRHQRVLPLRLFIIRLSRYGLVAMSLVVFSIGGGVIGYHYFGEISWLESFHMACMILTGMGPVVELTRPSAVIFSSLYALYSGIVFLGISAIMFTPVLHRLLHILHVEEASNR